jgi:ABC-2 type transport system permease protein
MSGSARRIWGLVYRHLCLCRKSWPRLLELAYWPVLQMLIWGLTAKFLFMRGGGSLLLVGGALLGGVLLWEVAMRCQMGVALGFLEELWSRNLGHVFVSPLRPWEMVAALIAMSVLRMVAGVVPAIGLAWLLYAFNLFALGPVLVLFFANLMLMGWAVSFGVMALILRYGAGAEALAWSVLAGLTPICAVYYPAAIIPMPWRLISLAMPASHVFEGMRATLRGTVLWGELGWAFGLNLVWGMVAIAVFAAQFRSARRRGALLSIGE